MSTPVPSSPSNLARIALLVGGLVAVAFGFSLLSNALWGAVFLWWLLGISLLVLGLLNVFRAIIARKEA